MSRHSEPGAAAQTEVADYVERDWQRYQARDELKNHWDRPGWSDGRRSYHWMLTFEDATELQELATRCQATLRDIPTLDMVPPKSLHITLQRAAFTDEVSKHTALAIADAAAEACAAIPPLVVRVGPLAGSAGAVRFSAGPHPPICHVRNAVRGAIVNVRGKSALPEDGKTFIPHVSIAYSNASVPAAALILRVAALRALGSVTARIAAVCLVELRREGRSYAWETVARVALGG
jgi:2'-5' RNA ligase